MIRKILIIAVIFALASCAAVNVQCDGTRDGGIGGTGGCVASDAAV